MHLDPTSTQTRCTEEEKGLCMCVCVCACVRACVCVHACVCVCVCICACVHPCVHACVHDLYCMLCPRPACYEYDLDLHALSLQLHIDQSSDCQYVADVDWGSEPHNDRHAMSLHQAVHNGVFSESNSTGMQVN